MSMMRLRVIEVTLYHSIRTFRSVSAYSSNESIVSLLASCNLHTGGWYTTINHCYESHYRKNENSSYHNLGEIQTIVTAKNGAL